MMHRYDTFAENFVKNLEGYNQLMEKTGVVCTPGTAFGPMGEGYVRFALVLPKEELEEVVEVIDKSNILKKSSLH